MATQLNVIDDEPWYRQGWPWFLMGLPATAVVAGLTTFYLAGKDWDGLVVDDYYKEGEAVVKLIDRLEHARSLGLSAVATVRDEKITVRLSAAQEKDLPAALHLTIIHPTRSGMDQQVLLRKEPGGEYSGAIAPLRAMKWRFQLEDESRAWRMNGVANIPTETEVLISPSDSQTVEGGVSS